MDLTGLHKVEFQFITSRRVFQRFLSPAISEKAHHKRLQLHFTHMVVAIGPNGGMFSSTLADPPYFILGPPQMTG